MAVAANFLDTLQPLVGRFQAQTGHVINISSGSTGKLYAQIVHGAPYDVFLAADVERPRRLIEEGHAVVGSARTYALGVLVLWSSDPDRLVEFSAGDLPSAARIALANPATAPYGRAAQQALQRLGLWEQVQPPLLVRGESVTQAFQFVATGNAEVGFVAAAQLSSGSRAGTGSRWIVPPSLYDPIAQDAVLLRRGSGNAAARAFMQYLAGSEARRLIEGAGYRLPGDH